jgi:methionyl-tRNA formyltransferase
MRRFIILTEKPWHRSIISILESRKDEDWKLISNKEDFNLKMLNEFKPEKVFIPHWSYIIPKSIWTVYPCIVFHMTDLPYGRGGSPLQNLIIDGKLSTKITALQIDAGIDTGDIYLKKDLSLSGTAIEIFKRATPIILEMIVEILENNLTPVKQKGNPVNFRRRKPEESSISSLSRLDIIYDYIRMLDCEGYPKAFIENSLFKFEFSDAEFNNNEIIANVRITKK